VRRSDGSPLRAAHQILAWMLMDLTGEAVAIGSINLVVTVPRSAGPTRPSQVMIGRQRGHTLVLVSGHPAVTLPL
jgi:hypothetical protein